MQNFFGTYEPIADFEMIKIGYNIVKALKIDKDSRILFFSTEGDTDPDKYKDIVWDGDYTTK